MTPAGQLLTPVATRLLASGVRLGWARFHETPVGDSSGLLAANGLDMVGRKRQAEFLAGRALVCAAFGIPELPRSGSGAPVWPAGRSGAMTHSKGCVAALVGPVSRRMGLDLESLLPEPSVGALMARALTPGERRSVLAMAAPRQARCVTLIFSAKETVYKALSGEARGTLDFQAVRLIGCSGGPQGRWSMQLTRRVAPDLPEGACLTGWFAWHDDRVLTCLDMPRQPPIPRRSAPESGP